MKRGIYILVLLFFTFVSCKGKPVAAEAKNIIEAPDFNSDSAYFYTEKQLQFGYRIPNTKEHKAAADFLGGELARYGADTVMQRGWVTAYDGTKLDIVNIIGSFSPKKERRVLLFAHWDSRPYADNDPDSANHRKPIAGADDGAASVAVLLEIARQIGIKSPSVGVDIIFFDAEDYGTPYFYEGGDGEDTWALGTQYWCDRPHIQGYRAEYGILLDMVSGQGSRFYQEQVSMHYASGVVRKIWDEAHRLGYGAYFPKEKGGAVTDDHLYVNRMGVPSADIIAYDQSSDTGFPSYWHTLRDDIRNIDRNTMKAVGQTVLSVIYNE
ncbi:MAG: M28 family peptidase [Bacteroidales bacterium]